MDLGLDPGAAPPLRSLLFAGATRPDLIAKLPRAGADAVIVDLEDSVPEDRKAEARAALPELVAGAAGDGGVRVMVRINGSATPWHEADLAAVAALPLAGVLHPMVERAEELAATRALLPEGVLLVAGLESARGVSDAAAILTGGAGAAYFGAEDFTVDMGGRRTAGGQEVLFARSQVALAARLAGVPAIDSVVVDFRDDAGFDADAELGRAIGYRGKLCIHPGQVERANRAFGASPEEVARARALIAAWEAGVAEGRGAVNFEGTMVDLPIVRMAMETLSRGGASA